VPAPKPGTYKARLVAFTDRGEPESEPFDVEVPKL
jgi:hypothetical protein